MTSYHPRNDLILVEKLDSEQREVGGIILPDTQRNSKFIKLRVLKYGSAVTDLTTDDVVLAEDMWEPIEINNDKLGVINNKYVHIIIKDGK